MHFINEYNFKNSRALIRVDFNVPLDNNLNVTDDTRIKAALPTIKKVLNDGGAVVLISHLGRPKHGVEAKFSLKAVIKPLEKYLDLSVKFTEDCIGKDAQIKATNLKPGDVLLLENVRFYKEETAGDNNFAKKLASLGDVFINDAFGTIHRAHASTAIIAQYFEKKFCGFLIKSEIDHADHILKHAENPFIAIMGGAKVSDKMLIIENLLDKIDHLIIGGGMCYTFFKAMGGQIGNSLVEDDKLVLAQNLLKKAKEKNVQIHLPKDSIIADHFGNEAKHNVSNSMEIPNGWMGLDIGPEAQKIFTSVISNAKTILWNGPMGVFELSNFAHGTISIAQAVANTTQAGAFSLIGGGDSAAAINSMGLQNEVSYVSTGGGALLEYMEGKTLPGLAALEK